MALTRIAIPSPNYSSRGGAGVRIIVLHTAEGSKNFTDLGRYFANPNSQVSSHVGIDDTVNTIGEYVRHDYKSWTCANFNPVAVQAEMCAWASWSLAEWNKHPTMLSNCAAWVAEEASRFGIPLVRLTPEQAQGSGRGVCQHRDLGRGGGGHIDCGNDFPINAVLSMASGGSYTPAPAPPPAPPTPGGAAPPFPYPPSDYLGQPSSDPHCHSGYYGGPDNTNVAIWQRQMAARGWNIGPIDGCYGPTSSSICRQFQEDKGLSCDGLCGPQTWATSWTAPVT